MSINHNLRRESSPVAFDTLILDNSKKFQSVLALSKSGIDRISTTKIVKLNTEINFFIKHSHYFKNKCWLVSAQLALLFLRHKGKFIIHKNKKFCWLVKTGD
jgi:hypothetical protein